MSETGFDRHARKHVARQHGRPRWQKLVGNFGFGFLFLGALANLGLFVLASVLQIDPDDLYRPWWLTCIALCCIAGLSWRLYGRSMA